MAVDTSNMTPLQELTFMAKLPDVYPDEVVEKAFTHLEDESEIKKGRRILRRDRPAVSDKVEAGLTL